LIVDAVGQSNFDAAVISQSPNAVTEGVEYAAVHFHIRRDGDIIQKLIPFLCSMKFRENNSKETPEKVAKTVHDLIQSLGVVSRTEYYVMVYCCHKKAQLANIPPGTIVVPFETLGKVMKPFGASCLLSLATQKANKV
jgi:hypothetical protein